MKWTYLLTWPGTLSSSILQKTSWWVCSASLEWKIDRPRSYELWLLPLRLRSPSTPHRPKSERDTYTRLYLFEARSDPPFCWILIHLVKSLRYAVISFLQPALQLSLLFQEPQSARVGLQHRLDRWSVISHHLWRTSETEMRGSHQRCWWWQNVTLCCTLLTKQHVDVGRNAESSVGDVF